MLLPATQALGQAIHSLAPHQLCFGALTKTGYRWQERVYVKMLA